jgi:hypothetical protein
MREMGILLLANYTCSLEWIGVGMAYSSQGQAWDQMNKLVQLR